MFAGEAIRPRYKVQILSWVHLTGMPLPKEQYAITVGQAQGAKPLEHKHFSKECQSGSLGEPLSPVCKPDQVRKLQQGTPDSQNRNTEHSSPTT